MRDYEYEHDSTYCYPESKVLKNFLKIVGLFLFFSASFALFNSALALCVETLFLTSVNFPLAFSLRSSIESKTLSKNVCLPAFLR